MLYIQINQYHFLQQKYNKLGQVEKQNTFWPKMDNKSFLDL